MFFDNNQLKDYLIDFILRFAIRFYLKSDELLQHDRCRTLTFYFIGVIIVAIFIEVVLHGLVNNIRSNIRMEYSSCYRTRFNSMHIYSPISAIIIIFQEIKKTVENNRFWRENCENFESIIVVSMKTNTIS